MGADPGGLASEEMSSFVDLGSTEDAVENCSQASVLSNVSSWSLPSERVGSIGGREDADPFPGFQEVGTIGDENSWLHATTPRFSGIEDFGGPTRSIRTRAYRLV